MTLDLSPTVLAVLAITGTALGLLGTVLAAVALRRLGRLRRDLALLHADDDAESFVAAVARQVEAVDVLRSEVTGAQTDIRGLRLDVTDAIRHVAVVRYDAFGDMGGRMSFSAALVDDDGDGVVLTSINGRSETRTYAKGVQGGASELPLSPEEQQAVDYARRGRG